MSVRMPSSQHCYDALHSCIERLKFVHIEEEGQVRVSGPNATTVASVESATSLMSPTDDTMRAVQNEGDESVIDAVDTPSPADGLESDGACAAEMRAVRQKAPLRRSQFLTLDK